MSEVVQAKCPQCHHVLRIPANWLGQAMKCKHCQLVFQARGKPAAPNNNAIKPAQPALARPAAAVATGTTAVAKATPATTAAAVAVAAHTGIAVGLPVTTPAAPSNTFAFDNHEPSTPTAPRPRRVSGTGRWKGILIGSGILAAVAITLVVFGEQILESIDRGTERTVQDLKKLEDGGKKLVLNTRSVLDLPGGVTETPKKTEKVSEPPPGKTEKKKEDPPRKTEPASVLQPVPKPVSRPTPAPTPTPTPTAKKGLYPRRALAISVNDYLLANPLTYGNARVERFPGSSTGAVLKELGNFHLNFPNTQLFELTDATSERGEPRSSFGPLLPVMKSAIEDYLNAARAQDRVVVLFSGHTHEDEKEAYLVPLEGDLKKPESLLPLNWVYERLKACKARQKVLVLDVCRFSPSRGKERPGGEAMGEVLDRALLNPPAGVQVWSSCVKEQQSYEFESGSIFQQALCAAMQERLPGFPEPEQSLPLDALVPRVNKYIDGLLSRQKLKQTTRLTGTEMQGGAPYNADEPLGAELVLKAPPIDGGAAGTAIVQRILDEINKAPPPRAGRPGSAEKLRLTALPPFPARILDEYKADYDDEMGFEGKERDFPLRAAVVKAKKVLQENATKFAMREVFNGAATAQVKKVIEAEQKLPAKAVFYIEQVYEDLKKAGDEREKETAKRWQAHYDYVLARVKARLIYLTEYNYVLAQIRTDSLPALEDGFSGYRVGSREKVTVPEATIKKLARDLPKDWERIANQYADTPWALMARREQMTALGLEWRSSRD